MKYINKQEKILIAIRRVLGMNRIKKWLARRKTKKSQFPFSKDQVRILLFRECDWRGRRLLFDSSAIEAVSVSSSQPQSIALNGSGNQTKQLPFKPIDKNHNIEYYEGKPYKYGRSTQEFNQIAEMVFGSVAISFRGTSFKVHWLRSPTRVLCSQVFLAPVQPYLSASSSSSNTHSSSAHTHLSNYGSDLLSEISGSMSETNSINSFSVSDIPIRTNPLDVPTALSLDNDDFKFISQSIGESSGYNSSELWTQHRNPYSSARSSLASIYSDIETYSRKMSISSSVSEYPSCEFGHFNRRIMKNLSTSFENVSHIAENASSITENNYYTVTGASNVIGFSDGCVSKLRRNSEIVETSRRKTTSGDVLSSNSSTIHHHHHHRSKRPRLAVAVCINMSEGMENEMLMFCSEHMALLEQMIYRLRATAENAYINKQNFLQLMIKCWHLTSQWLNDLFSAPRIVSPIWLSLSVGDKNSNSLANEFMHDLCHLLSTADTKDTNFFISTLLTAVLTHHLGWVGTVAPLMTSNVRETLNKNGTNPLITKLIEEENLKLSEISKIYSYNALWAQLGDLYGAITNPIKLSKTIVCGNDVTKRTIHKLLNILTYFIRCSEIRRNSHTKVLDKDELNKIVNQQLNQRKVAPVKKFPTPSISNNQTNMLRNVKKLNSGLTRTATTVKDLNKTLEQDDNLLTDSSNCDAYRLLMKILKKNVMNDIPKVLAFRDSRFVKQELRIGNKSMDTGIEMSAKDRQFLSKYQKNIPMIGDQIKLTVTRPDNDGIEETIELDDDDDDDDNFISLSNLITENSLGGSQRSNVMIKMFWERNHFKEALNLEQIKHLERISAAHQQQLNDEKKNEKLNMITESADEELASPEICDNKSVVFVLGDDEKLVGIKTSPSVQTICDEASTSYTGGTKKKLCSHNKKHSGVKFNFEKYPQIATNYMKSKNLEFSELEVLEKGMKLRREVAACSTSQLKSSDFASSATLQYSSDSDDECEFCQDGNEMNYLTTPSNATELEFSSDQLHESGYSLSSERKLLEEPNVCGNAQNFEAKKNEFEDDMKIIEIPMLENVKKQSVQDEIIKPGFTSSLFTSTNDHYISDMVLQGVTSTPSKWELQLKQDLMVSSHSAVLEQAHTENVAIVANIDKWEVRLISSHSNVLPSHNTANGIIGMSQLVASMLECVQMMFNSGVSVYQCLSYIESKLREMYLHSETLASFLMDTEFCSLSTLTNTLNLSANDIPLLMSIATIHSPQVAKKYGISFR